MKRLCYLAACAVLLSMLVSCAAQAQLSQPAPTLTPVEATAEPTTAPTPTVMPTPTLAPYTGVCEPQDAYRTYYEIFVGSFYDSDGDGKGDINGVRQKLDYINDCRAESNTSLHAGGIWLMPIMPSPTYHKYDTTDYYAVDPDYGTLDDFRALVDECSERGVSVVIDLMLNHSSDKHPWFVSACKSIGVEPCGSEECTEETLCREHNIYCRYYNFSQEVAAGYHPVPGVSGWYYEGQFWSGMPDFNLDSEEVWEEFRRMGEFWLDMGVSGFRLDATTSYYTGAAGRNAEALARIYDMYREIKEDVYLVGEAWSDAGTILSYYESGVPSLFNFPMSQSTGEIISDVRSGKGAKLAEKIVSWQEQLRAASADSIDAPFLSNHDNARSAGALMRDAVLQKQAAAVYLLMPGNPFIYYGEEIGMTGGSDKDENKRTPLVWSLTDDTGIADPPKGANDVQPVAAGVAEQLCDPDSLLRAYIEIIRYKNSNPAIARGTLSRFDAGYDAVCAYALEYEGERYLVMHNLSENESAVIDAASYSPEFLFGAGVETPSFEGGTLIMPPHSSAVMK